MVRKIFVASAGIVAVLSLAACTATSASGSSGLTNVTPSATSSGTPTATPTPTVTVTATPTTTGTNACKGTNLTEKVDQAQGAAGTIVQRFVVTNKSSAACTMKGHPGISPFGLMTQGSNKVEANLNITVDPIPSNFGELGQAAALQTLAPGGTVVFFLKWSQVPVGAATCPNADGFEFSPPGAGTSDQTQVNFKFTPCGTSMQVSNILPSSVGG